MKRNEAGAFLYSPLESQATDAYPPKRNPPVLFTTVTVGPYRIHEHCFSVFHVFLVVYLVIAFGMKCSGSESISRARVKKSDGKV